MFKDPTPRALRPRFAVQQALLSLALLAGALSSSGCAFFAGLRQAAPENETKNESGWDRRCAPRPAEAGNARLNYFADGGFFLGAWKDLAPQGRGQRGYCNASGLVALYEGEVQNGLPHGQGTMHWSDGRSLEARWQEGLPQSALVLRQAGREKRAIELRWLAPVHGEEYRQGEARSLQGTSALRYRPGVGERTPDLQWNED